MDTNTAQLVARAKSIDPRGSLNHLAKRLGVAPTTLSRVMNRGGTLDNEAAFKLADMLRLPRDQVIALIEQDRAKTPEKKDFWRRIGPRLAPTIVVALAAVVGTFNSGRSLASDGSHFVADVNRRSIHYAKYLLSWLYRKTTALRASIASLSQNGSGLDEIRWPAMLQST